MSVPMLFIASETTPELSEIPEAKASIKSGIQLSISASGPSSGTVKCRKERILSATPVTASATASIFDLMPETIFPIRSDPQEKACDTRFFIKSTAALKPSVMVDFIFAIGVAIAEAILLKTVSTAVLMAFTTLVTVLFMEFHAVLITDLIVPSTEEMAELIAVHTVLITFLMAFMTVETAVDIVFQTVVTVFFIPSKIGERKETIAFHTVVITDWIALITSLTMILMARNIVSNKYSKAVISGSKNV